MKRLLGLLGWLGVAPRRRRASSCAFTRPDLQPLVSAAWRSPASSSPALYALSQWRDIARSFQGRNVKYGSIAAGSVLVVLGILVGINWISNRQNKRWDLTAGGQFSLSDQTRQILAGLDQPLVIKAFYVGQRRPSTAIGSTEYPYLSKQVTIEYIDADSNPLEAQKYGITTVPTIILEYDGRIGEGHGRRRAGHHERAEEGHRGQGEEGLLRPGPRRARPDGIGADGLQRDRRRAQDRQLRSRAS